MSCLRAHACWLGTLALAACAPRHTDPGPIEHPLGVSTAPAPDPVTSHIDRPDAGNEIVSSRPLSTRAPAGGGGGGGGGVISGGAPAAPARATGSAGTTLPQAGTTLPQDRVNAAPNASAPTSEQPTSITQPPTAPPPASPAPAESPPAETPTGVLAPPPPSNP